MSRITKESVKREAKKNGITLGWVVISLGVAYGFFFVMTNLSHGSLSWWVGLGAPLIVIGALVALFLGSTDKTNNVVGPIIVYGTVVILIAIVVLLIVFNVFAMIELGTFVLGVVDFVIVIGLVALWRFHAWLINKFNN
jgi:hypothetical protein